METRKKQSIRKLLESVNCRLPVEIQEMDEDTVVEDAGKQSLYGGGYKDFLYRVKGSDDLIRVRKHVDESEDCEVFFESGYFKKRLEYANRIGDLSRAYKIPFRVSLAIGDCPERFEAFKEAIKDVDTLSIQTLRDLRAGISRRKQALKEVLGEPLYDELKIEEMGQDHSERIAHFIWDRAMARINS